MSEYVGALIALFMAAAIAGAFLLCSSLFGPKSPSAVKSAPFECGKEPFAVAGGRFSVKFYLTAMLFILFDVEVVFLFPWAVVCRALGARGLAEMAIFLGVLMAGFFYVWDNGALEWQ